MSKHLKTIVGIVSIIGLSVTIGLFPRCDEIQTVTAAEKMQKHNDKTHDEIFEKIEKQHMTIENQNKESQLLLRKILRKVRKK